MSKLIGTNPNQVPSNADLGSAAFMDAKDFLTSRGSSLSSVDVTIPSTAIDVLVYNTALDSDGGAWRKKTGHTSWYNEELNTATRGSRREFPAIALIVATTTEITIYDADDPSLPMWMKIQELSGSIGTLGWSTGGTLNITKIAMLNGILISVSGLTSQGGGSVSYNFPADDTQLAYPTANYELISSRLIADRHQPIQTTTWVGDGPNIVGYQVYDVDMRVLPNSIIDTRTGLPVPTVTYATASGVSVVHSDGHVADWSSLGQRACKLSDEKIYVSYVSNGRVYVDPIPNKDVANYAGGLSSGTERHYRSAGGSYATDDDLYYADEPNENTIGPHAISVLKNDRFAVGTDGGLSIFRENAVTPNKGMVAHIGHNYNTGYMLGDCRLASLCDTDTSGPTSTINLMKNHITNGTFDTNASGWGGDSGAVITWASAYMIVSQEPGGDTTYAAAQNIGTISAGDHVYVKFRVNPNNTGRMRVRLGGSLEQWSSTTLTANIWQTIEFTAIAEGGRIEIASNGGAGITQFFIDDVEIKKLNVRDHRARGRGFVTYGGVYATNVAPGSDIVAYTNFTSGNYNGNRMEIPYSDELNPGSGDYCVSVWLKDVSNGNDIMGLGKRGTDLAWNLYHDAGGGLRLTISNNGTVYESVAEVQFSGGISHWTHLVWVKKGNWYSMYINGSLKVQNQSSLLIDTLYTTSRAFMIGSGQTNNTTNSDLKVSMLKISKSAPEPEQVWAMHQAEKELFAHNAKATLYGDSNAVLALDYDRVTEELHAGGTYGRSVFNELVRTDYSTNPVSLSISASNGRVAEE